MASKKKPARVDTITRPQPTADGEEHLFEVKLAVIAPVGVSLEDVWGVVAVSVIENTKGQVSVVAGYGAAVQNKTLNSAGARAAYGKKFQPRMICTGFTNKSVPKDGDIPVLTVKKKEASRGKRG